MKKLNTLKVQAFTLVEMLIVLLVISVLLLLFVPNLTKQKDAVSSARNRQIHIRLTMENTVAKLKRLPIKAFTLLESLLVLFVVSFLLLGLSGSVRAGFNQVQEQLFFLEFERLYQETQRLSVAGHEKLSLKISGRQISNGYQELDFPQTLQEHEQQVILFDRAGGNSSLSKITFQTEDRTVVYQLYMGNGKFKKTTASS